MHCQPADTPEVETRLSPGKLITAIEVPAQFVSWRSHYLEVRDRARFEWALASAAIALDLDGQTVRDARVAVGGVATSPWRLPAVESVLRGQVLTKRLARDASECASAGSIPRERNAYKIELIKRTVARALEETGALA